MKQRTKKAWIFVLMLILFYGLITIGILTSSRSYVEVHEETHKTIYRQYDISSETETHILYGYTYADADEYYERCDENCILSQNFIEIIGYHVAVLMVCMWIMVATILIYFTFFFPYFNQE